MRRRYSKYNKNTAHAIATNSLSPPDAQVEEHLLILHEPEEERPSGTTTTILPTEQDEGETNEILPEPTTPTGQYCIRASPFTTYDEVSPRNQATTKPTSSEHLHRARPFAAAEE